MILFVQCSNRSKEHKAKKGSIASQSTHEIQPGELTDSIWGRELDSLELLMEAATHDTIRLRILSTMTTIASDDSTIAVYNEQIETIARKNLAANLPESAKTIFLRFLSDALHTKGNIYTDTYEFSEALKYFNESLLLRKEIGDTIRISSSYINIGNTYSYLGDNQKAREFYERSVELSQTIGDKRNMARALHNIGSIYADEDDIPKAREYYTRSMKLREELGDKKEIARTLNGIGITYSYEGDMPKALECYSKSLKISEELGDKISTSYTLSNIGVIYEYQKDFSKALEYYERSLKIQEELGDKKIISAALTNIGNVYIDLSEVLSSSNKSGSDSLTNLALEYYYRSKRLSEEIDDNFTLSETLINIGQTYDEQAEVIKSCDSTKADSLKNIALECYYESLRLSEKLGNKSSISFALVYIGTIYLERNEVTKALSCAKRAYKIAKETGYKFNIKDATQLLDKVYARLGNYKLSRQYYGEYITMNDSIIKEQNQQFVQKKYYQYQYEKKAATDSIAHSKEMQIANLEIEKQKAESRRQKMAIGFIVFGLLLVLVFAGYIFRSLRITRQQKNVIENQKKLVEEKNLILNEQNEEIKSQRDQIETQRDEITIQRDMVTRQKEQIEHIHLELTDSIRYAERIQNAVLPSDDYIKELLAGGHLSPDSYFILYKPRDIVSGDFYFFGKRKNALLIAVADCTGHGVPGAFMSMLGLSFLSQIIAQENNLTASQILDELRDNIIHSLQQKGITGEQKDGIDISLVLYDTENTVIQFSGAYNPLYIMPKNSNELLEIKPDRMPVAISEDMIPFTNHDIKLGKGDILYLASDGFEDQFGGPRGKKFYSKYLRQLLTEISVKPMAEQKEILDKTIEDWKNGYAEKYEQTDDITVLGITIV